MHTHNTPPPPRPSINLRHPHTPDVCSRTDHAYLAQHVDPLEARPHVEHLADLDATDAHGRADRDAARLRQLHRHLVRRARPKRLAADPRHQAHRRHTAHQHEDADAALLQA
eukprot:352428-Chlamydomonas_euryale.AAC.12